MLVLRALFLEKVEGFAVGFLGSREWILIILSGIAGAFSWLFYFVALKYGFASKVVAIDRLSIIFVVIFAVLFLGESFGWETAFGAVLMALGAILISWK